MKKSFLCLILAAGSGMMQLASAVDLTPAAGPQAVGVRLVQQLDQARSIVGEPDIFGEGQLGEHPRPVQTLLWYPAKPSSSPRVHFLDYLQTTLTEDNFALPATEIAKKSAQWTDVSTPRGLAARQRMLAVRDAAPAKGAFPVLIYAPSFAASAAENADLCEYLASHGYIVLASASRGARTPTMTEDVDGLEAQAADIAYLLSYAQTLPSADMSRVAVVGFSWGGLANVFAAARSSRIKALVSLDGSVRSYTDLITTTGYVTPARVTVPMLSIGSRPDSIERLNERKKSTASSFLNSMKYSDVYLATMQPMDHMHFAGIALRQGETGSGSDYTADEIITAHNWTARYVRAFLDAYLKQDAQAQAFLKNPPSQNGVPAHMMTLAARPASAVLPSETAFIMEFKRRGYKDALPIYASMRKDDPAYVVPPIKLNRWGYQLLAKGQHGAAIELFKLAITIEPEWGGVHDSLGEAYEAAGEKALAIAAYERALQLDPKLISSQQRLRALR